MTVSVRIGQWITLELDKNVDVGDFGSTLARNVKVPFLIDGKRGEWKAQQTAKVADCEAMDGTCRHELRVTATVTKPQLQKLASSKRTKLRPFSGLDCELSATTKRVIGRFLHDAPALK